MPSTSNKFSSTNQSVKSYKKPIVIAAAIVALLLLVFVLYANKGTYVGDLQQVNFTSAATNGVSLALPVSVSTGVNQTVEVPITLTTNGYPVIGVDYVIAFDKSVLKLTNITSNTATVLNKLYPRTESTPSKPSEFKLQEVLMSANGSGKINFSEIVSNPTEDYYIGSSQGTVVATLVFQGLKNDISDVSFDFTPGSAQDTNVAVKYVDTLPPCVPSCSSTNQPKDELTAVSNGSVVVGTVSSSQTPKPTTTATPRPTNGATPTPSHQQTHLYQSSK
jgi:hypothetical protein